MIYFLEQRDGGQGLKIALGLVTPFQNFITDAILFVAVLTGLVLVAIRSKRSTICYQLVFIVWFIFFFVFAALFISQLAAVYTTNRINKPRDGERFQSVEELAAQSEITYGSVRGGSTEAFFADATYATYARMW